MKVPQFPSIQTLKSVKSVGVLMMTLLQLPIMVNSSPLIFFIFLPFSSRKVISLFWPCTFIGRSFV